MRPKRFPYKGNTYTLQEIYQLFPDIKPSVLAARLHKGMTVAEAISPQTWEEHIPEEYRYQVLVVCFDSTPPVFPHRQPDLHKRYIAVPHAEGKRGKMFYVVQVKDKPLIVYPGEFRILGIAKRCEEQECAPPYGDKADCELHTAGYCTGVSHPKGEALCG